MSKNNARSLAVTTVPLPSAATFVRTRAWQRFGVGVAAAFLALIATITTSLAANDAKMTTAITPETGHLVVDVHGVPPPAPVFFSVSAEQIVRVSPVEIAGQTRLRLRVVQGRPESLTLGLSGEGEVVGVSGKGLRDWSVRQGEAADKRFLDLRLLLPIVPATTATPLELELFVRTRCEKHASLGAHAVLLITRGEAVGFASKVSLQADSSVELRVMSVTGMTPLGEPLQFFSTGEARLEVQLGQRGTAPDAAELIGAQLTGKVSESGGSVDFHLRGQLRAQRAGARLRLLTGLAALSGKTTGEGWHIELTPLKERRFAYDLVCEREGLHPVDVVFAAAVLEDGDWRRLDFTMPAGAVVPLQLEGLGADVSFKSDFAVVPIHTAQGWRGFLPANGSASLGWKRLRETGERALAFTSVEQTEVRLGAGLLRQSAQITFRILQGTLASVRCQLYGPGEILGVEGSNVIGWKVLVERDTRVLDVRFNRPMEAQGTLTIHSQTELGSWPVRVEPMRIKPEGGVRHSGLLRIANHGAVRLEVAEVTGLMQLAPTQFPGPAIERDSRQVFVYRFPSDTYGYRVLAAQIQPEVGVSVIATCELAETTRVLNASLELDVREAALRDWTLRIPADYTVVALTGSDVTDYVAESEVENTTRAVRVMFGRPVEGRQLLQLRLEKNQPAATGDWNLPALRFPGAKSVRGYLGAVATPGYRIVPARADRLVEVPLSFFPKQTAGLQQAWRIREPDWAADVRVEALGQSVQADVFHLYSLKEGVVTTSVLLNYFVVGAPASEWRIEIPATVGNIDVIGQNVRRDWRREGDQLVVSLHQPVLGSATLLITFEQPMSARGGIISPGQVRPLGVQAERGFIQVVSPLQVKHEIRRAEGGLLKLEPMELPAEFRLLTSSPSLAVYQYTARPFTLEMNVEWYAPGESVEQVVDFATLSSQVSRDGQVVTEAKFFVKTRGRKALRLILPPGVKLWEARVDHEIVNARADGEQTLIPLPARMNPNEPVVVALRVGQAAAPAGSRVNLFTPRLATAPTIISEWVVRSDTGRLLVPIGGSAELVRPPLTETGFEWLSKRAGAGAIITLSLVGLGALLRQARSGWRVSAGLFVYALATAGAALLTSAAVVERRANQHELSYAGTIVRAGETIALHLANVPEWRAMIVGWGVIAALAGILAVAVGGWIRRHEQARVEGKSFAHARSGMLIVLGILLLATGLLAQRGGAVLFFGAVGATLFLRMLVPAVMLWRRGRSERGLESGPDPAGVVPLLAFAGLTAFVLSPGVELRAASAPSPKMGGVGVPSAISINAAGTPAFLEKTAQSIVQNWMIRGERLFADAEVIVRGGVGDSFLLLQSPAVLTDLNGDGLHVSKVEREGQTVYYVALEREGMLTARIRFEMPLRARDQPIALPTGAAATQRITVDLDQGGWMFGSPTAVQVLPTTGLGAGHSGATLVLAPHGLPVIQMLPKGRDAATEAIQFFSEGANLYIPGPGVVNGFTRIMVRPVQGRVSALELEIPTGFTVGDVSAGPVGSWRFDPSTRRLQVAIEPAQTAVFKFEVETQLGAGELPFAIALEPLRVIDAAGDVGTIAIAFGGEAQPEGVRATGLSVVNVVDFDASLLPSARDGQAPATLQNVWRYGPAGGRVELKVAPVAPEVRVASRQVLSLDEDRMVMAADLRVTITRVGLFKLSFALPEGLEVESLAGAALNHWTEAQDGQQRVVTLHLNGRTIGEQAFNLTLAGAAPRAQPTWAFPRLLIREATRPTGEALIVPGKGIRLRAVAQEKVTQLDPRTVGGAQAGSLAFRLLQDDWVLRLEIQSLEAWITVQALQEVTLREGQTLTRIGLRYRVENAGVKHVQVRLPGLSEETTRTVRATGSVVSDMVRVEGATDLWEIRFQRAVAGETDVQIEFQAPATREGSRESLAPVEWVGARQTTLFVAVRGGGRLEIEPGSLSRGWTRIDWSAVPAVLQQRTDRSVPALCFRVAEPEAGLTLTVRRHDVADSLKLRVTQGSLTTLFAPSGAFVCAVDLKVEVLEKSTFRVRLPVGAQLFNTFVNGESVSVVRDGAAYLFYVTPNSAGDRAASVRLAYSANGGGKSAIGLVGPSLSVPLENVTWRVVLPVGYDLDDYSGSLRLREERAGAGFSIDQYVSLVSAKRSADTKEAMSLLQQASSWLQKGEQEKAGEALSRVSNGLILDQATNEDARVQLRNLKTQQAVLGLNTRRQKLYLDNRADVARNVQLEQAANLNPFLQGKANFDPQQADQLLAGNTSEENSALRGIAARIVDQQLGADPAPGAIDVTLPERGRVLTFTRSVQVDGGAPLELRLEIGKVASANWGFCGLLLAGLAAIAAMDLKRRAMSKG